MKKILLIYNPNSGKRNIASLLDKIIQIFASADKVVTLFRIGSKNNISLKDLIVDGAFDGVVVCGGDGSVNSVAKLILDNGVDLPLGIIPNGTCNDFSRSLGMPNDPLRCARLITQGCVMKIDIGYINGGQAIFVNELAGGVLVSASYSTDQNLKKVFGPLAYYMTGIGELANMKPFTITVTTEHRKETEDALVFLVLNGTDISGFSGIIKEALMQDGEMDILIFKNTNPIDLTDTLFKFVSGGNFRDENVVRIRTPHCTIECSEDITTTVDGEKGPAFPIELEMKKQALRIYH